MYALTPELRKRLKEPLGTLETAPPADVKITVGDIVSADAINAGLKPMLVVYDGIAMRQRVDRETAATIDNYEAPKAVVKNTAGSITPEALGAVRDALASGEKRKVEVVGEEDLLALACIKYAENGTVMCYGQPNEGVVVVRVNDNIKQDVETILNKMKVRE